MEAIAYLLPGLACAGMMGVMMWMMRGRTGGAPPPDRRASEIASLRSEVSRLEGQAIDMGADD